MPMPRILPRRLALGPAGGKARPVGGFHAEGPITCSNSPEVEGDLGRGLIGHRRGRDEIDPADRVRREAEIPRRRIHQARSIR